MLSMLNRLGIGLHVPSTGADGGLQFKHPPAAPLPSEIYPIFGGLPVSLARHTARLAWDGQSSLLLHLRWVSIARLAVCDHMAQSLYLFRMINRHRHWVCVLEVEG